MNSFKNPSQFIVPYLNLNQLLKYVQLLNLAINSTTTQTHKRVFQELKILQQKPQSYLYFLFIFLNQTYHENIRYMSATTMKSALNRNKKQIHFQNELKNIIKSSLLLSADINQLNKNKKLKSMENILISQLCTCFEQVDWQIIYFFINKINLIQNQPNYQLINQYLILLCSIFQDLKHNSQNYCYYQGSMQIQIFQKMITNLHLLMKLTLNNNKLKYENASQTKLQFKCFTQALKLLKTVTFHMPLKLCNYFNNYVNQIIINLLKIFNIQLEGQKLISWAKSQNFGLINNLLIQTLQSINQIASTKSTYLLQNKLFLDIFVIQLPITVNNFRKYFNQGIKIWTNTVLQLFFNDFIDQNSIQAFNQDMFALKMSSYLQIIIPKILLGFRFTKQDESNILNQMQTQHNPYQNQQSLVDDGQNNLSQDDDQKQFATKHGKRHGSTLRKISITCIQKICQVYKNNFWNINKNLITQLLKMQNDYKVQQSAILFIGLIAQNCEDQLRTDIESLLSFLIQIINKNSHQILVATSLWVLQKLLPCYNQNQQIKKYIYQIIYKIINAKQPFQNLKNQKNLMVKQSAISLLDQMFSVQFQINPQVLKSMLECLFNALQTFTGRALFNVFKTISTIFQQPQRGNIQPVLVNSVIKHICNKWIKCVRKDSIMCPLVQCLSLICQNRKKYFLEFSIQILKQIYPLFSQKQRKSLILRIIDLTTAIIMAAKQNQNSPYYQKISNIVSSQQFLNTLMNLVIAEQKQIRHFGYGLISDIIKLRRISIQKSEQFIQMIAKTMYRDNPTSTNNALMCLTDILQSQKLLQLKYTKQILQVIVDFIKNFNSSNLPKLYLLNFSRMFGRLANYDIVSAQYFLGVNPHLLKSLSQGLRSQQKSQNTLNAFHGISLITLSLTNQDLFKIVNSKQIQSYIDSFMGYKYNSENNQNMNQIVIILKKIKFIVQNQNLKWQNYLNSTLLYPATINKIIQITN